MTEQVQVAIVGGGPAGLSAALAAASAGATTVLFDENPRPGGQLRYRLAELRLQDGSTAYPPHYAVSLSEQAIAAGVDIRGLHRVWGLFAGNEIGVEHAGVSTNVRAERIVLANGSIDRSLPFPGGSFPGVFTGRAVQILLNIHFVLPGRRFAIIADEPAASELAHEIELAGGQVVVSVPATDERISVEGPEGIVGFTGQGLERAVDVVVVAAGRLADAGLALMAECAAGYSAAFGGFVPKIDERMQTSVDGIYAAGDCAGPCSPEIALLEGEYAGFCVAASLGFVADEQVATAFDHYRTFAPDRFASLEAVEGTFVQVERVPMGVGEQ